MAQLAATAIQQTKSEASNKQLMVGGA